MFKKGRNLIEYARQVIDLYEDHNCSKETVAFYVMELELDMALTKIELALRKMKDDIK
jgi:hypothetical protein